MAELIRKIVKSTNELNRVAYFSTINGVAVTASNNAPPFALSPPATPTPDLRLNGTPSGGGGSLYRPNHIARQQPSSSSYLKSDIELGVVETDHHHHHHHHHHHMGRPSSLLSPVRNFYTKTTTTAAVPEVQQRQDTDTDMDMDLDLDDRGDQARGGSETSSTVPLRHPRTRMEQESRDDIRGTYSLGV